MDLERLFVLLLVNQDAKNFLLAGDPSPPYRFDYTFHALEERVFSPVLINVNFMSTNYAVIFNMPKSSRDFSSAALPFNMMRFSDTFLP
ncbi:hypothetical protein [Oceanobacillus oncorhynchi]|uniref:hypothetical protein n=1 Tax=Oceanobacillus oncorhynchi TaxID=545501 RepID=UPI0031D1C49C